MRHEDHLRSHECRDSYILRQVIVIANQEADFDAEQVDHVVRIAWTETRVNKWVEFSIFCYESLGADGQIAVVEPAVIRGLDKPRHHDDAILAADRKERPRRRTIGNRLGDRHQLVTP